MRPENKKFLEDNERTWITLRDAGYMIGLDGNTRSEMVRVIREEFQPGYATDLWCPPCVADMVTLLYRYFNEWRDKHPQEPDEFHRQKSEMIEALLKNQEVQQVSEPIPAPVQVKATFPKHNKNHRR